MSTPADTSTTLLYYSSLIALTQHLCTALEALLPHFTYRGQRWAHRRIASDVDETRLMLRTAAANLGTVTSLAEAVLGDEVARPNRSLGVSARRETLEEEVDVLGVRIGDLEVRVAELVSLRRTMVALAGLED
ncbi:hypothetical protein C7974DRAFT_417615 [Boeremia exigua]|uniref:uncharacterized protein n=1 Tax=Boeremia exigua TaxID=749465 RepID=UPI001E8E76C7|nr:uncharacterized protein C7974DRAFT_417615 [Boeremia exigua]KAH6613867.1 hypothetical protein C7974DRAFT_417615 [Boeremia exigua]